MAWIDTNSNSKTQAVGLKKPNELGLYDMSGNVKEWCNDWLENKHYQKLKPFGNQNPTGPINGRSRILRGGNFRDGKYFCQVFFRNYMNPHVKRHGFRVVRTV